MLNAIFEGQLPFPSPCGEKVGINVKDRKAYLAPPDLFPSPCGEKVGINFGKLRIGMTGIFGFRPLAGKR